MTPILLPLPVQVGQEGNVSSSLLRQSGESWASLGWPKGSRVASPGTGKSLGVVGTLSAGSRRTAAARFGPVATCVCSEASEPACEPGSLCPGRRGHLRPWPHPGPCAIPGRQRPQGSPIRPNQWGREGHPVNTHFPLARKPPRQTYSRSTPEGEAWNSP